MFDWETMAKGLNDKEAISATISAMNLVPPWLIYYVSSNLSFEECASIAAAICGTGQDFLKDLKNMNKKIKERARCRWVFNM